MTVSETMSRAHSHGLVNEPVHHSRATKLTSFNTADFAIPTGREEEWRFTPMPRINFLFDDTSYATSAPAVEVTLSDEATYEVVPATDERLDPVLAPVDCTAVVSWNQAQEVHFIDIPRHGEVNEPIFIKVNGDATENQAQRIYVRAGQNSHAVVVLSHTGKANLNQTVEVNAADDAQITFVSLQEWDDTATHASNHRLRAGKNTKLRHIVVTLGGSLVRLSADTEFSAERGHIEMLGLYFVDKGQHFEHRPYIAHTEPNCYSRVTYKGALQGEGAHSVWVGDCLIGERADGTDTYELNRNLVLTEGTLTDSVPNLEIENGEIEGAGHASATGRFDDEQLFYLMARGIREADARRLVVRGFFAELINEIGIPAVQEHLMELIDAELEAGGALQGAGE